MTKIIILCAIAFVVIVTALIYLWMEVKILESRVHTIERERFPECDSHPFEYDAKEGYWIINGCIKLDDEVHINVPPYDTYLNFNKIKKQ